MKNIYKAFTLVELIVVVTILAILGSIGLVSYTSSLSDSRDSKRISSISLIKSALKTYNQKRGNYPYPGNKAEIQYSGSLVGYQGKLDSSVRLSTLEEIPNDPENGLFYSYSITRNRQEYQIAATLENDDYPKAILKGDYKSVSKNILPTLVFATGASNTIEIQSGTTAGDINRKLFIYNENIHNLIYDFDTNEAFSDGTDFEILLQEAKDSNNFWQSSDYRNCTEIKEAGKLLIPVTTTEFEYQIVDENGNITNTGCTTSNTN